MEAIKHVLKHIVEKMIGINNMNFATYGMGMRYFHEQIMKDSKS